MAFQESVAVRNARLNAIQTIIGASAILRIFSGAEPANCAAADPSGLLVQMTLPASWLNAASGGQITLAGSWSGTASGTGTAACFRIYDNGIAACHIQGAIQADMVLNNTSIAITQTVTVNTFTITAGNA